MTTIACVSSVSPPLDKDNTNLYKVFQKDVSNINWHVSLCSSILNLVVVQYSIYLFDNIEGFDAVHLVDLVP
ncbi:hypothetical protein AVEN_246633-1 [Araneus ventricosus]|uniref:Uncharacterized protein n=1 Tax=Araneus ventricosus TaxID=182803 RepID=A0A4Y2LLP0_ARAVE|nr:hypothetical protein AVEN_246633-1 [Araneus ventricosus]